MNIDPSDIIELMKSIEELKELVKLAGQTLDEILPTILETFAPTMGKLYDGLAGLNWYFYDALKKEGFSDEQAFMLLLNNQISLTNLLNKARMSKDVKTTKTEFNPQDEFHM